MQNGTGLLRCKFMRFSLRGRPDHVVVVIQYKDCIFLHHVLLGHGISVPYRCLRRHLSSLVWIWYVLMYGILLVDVSDFIFHAHVALFFEILEVRRAHGGKTIKRVRPQ